MLTPTESNIELVVAKPAKLRHGRKQPVPAHGPRGESHPQSQNAADASDPEALRKQLARAEARLAIAEKRLAGAAWKETLSVVTMGLAHDVNNLLAGVISFAELLIAKNGPENPDTQPLTLVKQGSLQASELVRRLMELHRSQSSPKEFVDFNQFVSGLVELASRVLPRNIKLQTELAPEALPIYVDSMALRQVVLNLALNAAEAMPQGGVLTFRLDTHTTGGRPAHAHGKLPVTPCACLLLQDTGRGIAAQNLPRLFEPFFTTKPAAKGMGLGLYVARRFVEEHAGAISVESTEGAGATFQLWLPQADLTQPDPAA